MSTTDDQRDGTAARHPAAPDHDPDAARLAELGYHPEFQRSMRLRENFSLGFTYLSPVVGVYTLFAFALATGGPPMIWSLLLVGAGQFLVALIFSEVVAQYPIAGGLYPWARRLVGKRWAWMAGWIYAWALLATIASVVYGSAPFAAGLFGLESTTGFAIAFALVVLGIATLVNLGGTRLLARVAFFGFAAELVGALAVGGYLLLFAREQSFAVLFDSFGLPADGGAYLGAFLAAGLIGLYQYYGFEACGDVAEEVPSPGRWIPRAMRMTIYVGGAAATFICLALVLATPDIDAVISGEDADPVGSILAAQFGAVGSKVVLVVVLISFVSCAMSLQAAVSRMVFSYARDDMIVGSAALRRISARTRVPAVPLAIAALIPALLVLTTALSTDALTKIVSFAALGIYIAFQMVVAGALVARLRGWVPSGAFQLGRWGLPVNVAALVYGVAAAANLAWPRTPDVPWYDNWVVLLSSAVVIVLGLAYMVIGRPYDRGTAPSGDAVPAAAGGAPTGR